MDVGKKGFINFKDVSVLLSMMCGTDIQKKLKLLYSIHLPGVVHPSELEQTEREGAEVSRIVYRPDGSESAFHQFCLNPDPRYLDLHV